MKENLFKFVLDPSIKGMVIVGLGLAIFACSSSNREEEGSFLSGQEATSHLYRTTADSGSICTKVECGAFSANLVRNPNGRDLLSHWEVLETSYRLGGGYWIAKRVAENGVLIGLGFRTSWNWARKRQRIAVASRPKLKNAVLLGKKLRFSAQEEYSRTYCSTKGDRKDQYYLTLRLLDQSGAILQSKTTGEVTAHSSEGKECTWSADWLSAGLELEVEDSSSVAFIEFEHGGRGAEFYWSGYGTRMRNASLRYAIPPDPASSIAITTLPPEEYIEVRASTLEIGGTVPLLRGRPALTYSYRGKAAQSVSLDSSNRFRFNISIPNSREIRPYLLQLEARYPGGGVLTCERVIAFVPQFEPDKVVARFSPSASQADIEGVVDALNGAVADLFAPIKLYEIQLPDGSDVLGEVAALRGNPLVAWALPNLYFLAGPDQAPSQESFRSGEPFPLGTSTEPNEPSDPEYQRQKAYTSAIELEKAWSVLTGTAPDDKEVVVAVLDSGTNWRHPDLAENIWQNSGEDCDGDGTLEPDGKGSWRFDPDDDGQDCDGDGDLDDDGNGYADDLIGWDFKERDNDPDATYFHGTFVAGIIGAVGHNSRDIAGVNWNARIMPVRVTNSRFIKPRDFEQQGSLPVSVNAGGSVLPAARAFAYAAGKGAHIINASFSAYLEVKDQMGEENFQALESLIKDVNDLSVLYLLSAGNFGTDLTLENGSFICPDEEKLKDIAGSRCRIFPQGLNIPNKIVVAATDRSDILWTSSDDSMSSNYSPSVVELAAPGRSVVSLWPAGGVASASGTSFSAPTVAGVASLVLARYPELQGQSIELKKRLLATADQLPHLAGSVAAGRRLNAFRAVGGGTDEQGQDKIPLLAPSTFLIGNRAIPTPTESSIHRIPGIYGEDKHLIACDIGEDESGDLDMIILTGPLSLHTTEENLSSGKSLLLVNNEGRFEDESDQRLARLGLHNILGGDCGDVDGDGDNDLILAQFRASKSNRYVRENKDILLLNNGSGYFRNASFRLPNIYTIGRDADFVDIDQDGDLDIFLANGVDQRDILPDGSTEERARSNVILLNRGSGRFYDASNRLPAGGNGNSHNAHIADVNGDGCLDIYVANQSSIDQLFINAKRGRRCRGRFTEEALSRGLLEGRDIAGSGVDAAHEGDFADIDGDGDVDLIIARRDEETNLIYINEGGHFTEEGSARLSPNYAATTSTLDVGDLNGDQCPDILFGNGDLNQFHSEQDHLYFNSRDEMGRCRGIFEEVGAQEGIPQGYINTTKDILFFDYDADSDLDVWFGNYGEVDLFLINTTIGGYQLR